VLVNLLKAFNSIPMDIEGDDFGRIYEYFLGKFALAEGQHGGEFFTPLSLVKLIAAEVIKIPPSKRNRFVNCPFTTLFHLRRSMRLLHLR
jgi:type I restriction-modification system DNA methylase subunit